MPTGYTHNIKDGIDFETFIMQCARGMGACITMRDDPSDKPIPEKFEVSTYHDDKAIEARKKLSKLETMGKSEINDQANSEYEKEMQEFKDRLNDIRNEKSMYKAMLDKAICWLPPTKDHIGLRDFMIKQIEKSIDFDCDENYLTEPKKKTTQEWVDSSITKARRDIEYHDRNQLEENERVGTSNAWLEALRGSLDT